MIPIILKLEEDEILYSYFQRLATANFLEFNEFMLTYVYPRKKILNINIRDYRIQMPYVLNELGIDDWSDFYLKTSLYPIISIALSNSVQRNTLRIAFGKYYDPRTEIGKGANGTQLELRECPECNKEKKYIRRSHCIPNVKACWKHGCSLTDQEVTQEDIDYAIFTHDLLNANLDIDISDTKKLVKPFSTQYTNPEIYLIELFKKYRTFDKLSKEINKKEITFDKPDFACNSKPFKKIVDITHNICGCRNVTTLADAELENCPLCLSKLGYKEYYTTQVEKLGKGKYKIISDYTNISDRIIMAHSCGIEYETTLLKFINGVRCHCESGFDKQFVKEMIENSGNYKFISYKAGFIKVHCGTCNKDFQTGFKKFKDKPECPKCKNDSGDNKLLKYQKMTKKIDPEFELVSHRFDSYQHIGVFKHLPCGTIVESHWGNFSKYHNCPTCHFVPQNTKKRGQEDYRVLYNKLKEKISFGDEFTSLQLIALGYDDPTKRRNLISSLKRNNLITPIKKGLWILNDEKSI